MFDLKKPCLRIVVWHPKERIPNLRSENLKNYALIAILQHISSMQLTDGSIPLLLLLQSFRTGTDQGSSEVILNSTSIVTKLCTLEGELMVVVSMFLGIHTSVENIET